MKKTVLLLLLSFSLPVVKSFCQPTCFQNNIISTGNTIDAYWSMDGNGNDALGVSNNPQGTLGAGVTFTGTAFAGTGAASFAGTGGIQYSDGTFMNSLITNVSFGAWIKPNMITPTNRQIIFEEGGTFGISVYLNVVGEIVFVVSKGNQANSTDLRFTFPTDGQYHHIAFNYNGRLEIFLDGLFQQSQNTGFGNITAHTDAGGIGAIFGATSAAQTRYPAETFTSFTGLMDEVYYSRNLINDGNMLQYGRCYGRNIYNNIGCPSDAFFVQGANGDYGSLNLVTGTMSTFSSDGLTARQNAIGFNTLDGMIYGLELDGSQVATGNIFATEVMATPSGYTYSTRRVAYVSALAGINNMVTGDIYDGKFYIRAGVSSTTFYVVDANPSSPTYLQLLQTVAASSATEMYDWAYNPTDSSLYGINAQTGDLWKINPVSGTATNLNQGGPSAVPADNYGAVFFDNQGFCYVYRNATGVIYRINISASQYIGVVFSTGPGGLSDNDGARCANAPLSIDFGDAPDLSSETLGVGTDTGQYNTMLSNGGPRHQINPFIVLRMGATVTPENDGKPNSTATGDADDGISSFPVIPGGMIHNVPSYSITASVTNASTIAAATLYGWIDWNNNGVFEVAERISATVPISFTGNVSLTWSNVTLNGGNGSNGVYARFRLSTDTSAEMPTGPASDGEVEDYFIPFSTPLPIQLLSFSLSKNNDCNVNVIWTTAIENSLDHFEVEHSIDGRNYSKIAKFEAKGSNSAYQFIDKASDSQGMNFYRLHIIDRDGNSSYSKEEHIRVSCGVEDITIAPNPTSSLIILKGLQPGTNIQVLNNWGQIVITTKAAGSSCSVDLSTLPATMYFITVKDIEGKFLKNFKLVRK